MAALKDIRAGIAAAIKAAFPQAQCTGYELQTVNPPAFEVEFNGVTEYDLAMSRGADRWEFIVRGLSPSSVLNESAQKQLDDWLSSTGPLSVKAALEADRTLSASVGDAHVTKVSPIKQFSPVASPGTSYYGAEWTLVAVAPGD